MVQKTVDIGRLAHARALEEPDHPSRQVANADHEGRGGVGAFGRAQAEGGKLFEGLVKEGLNFEQTARKLAGNRADVVRDAVESRVGQARERASDTWDRLEKVFEDRVQRALVKLGVPGREDVAALSQRVDALTAELRRVGTVGPGKTPRRTTTAATPAAKAPRKHPTKKASKKQPVA